MIELDNTSKEAGDGETLPPPTSVPGAADEERSAPSTTERGGATAARQAHTLKVEGSNPSPATKTYLTTVREDGSVELRGPFGSVVFSKGIYAHAGEIVAKLLEGRTLDREATPTGHDL